MQISKVKLLALLIIIMSCLNMGIPARAIEISMIDSDFELDSDGWSGQVVRVSEEAHSGSWSLKLEGEESINSALFPAEPHSLIQATAWIKRLNVVQGELKWHAARATLAAYKADQTTRIMHRDIMESAGSSDWKQIQGAIITPPETAYVRLSFSISNTSGTIWIDDVKADIAQTVPEVDLTGLTNPIVFPQPWQMTTSGEQVSFKALTFVLGNSENAELSERLTTIGGNWLDLGEQGYFVSISGTKAWLGANTPQGLCYAKETFNQLIDDGRVYEADIIDRPTLERRGFILNLQWFDHPDTYRRVAEAKLNFAWVQGSVINQKLWLQWQEPFTPAELDSIYDAVRKADRLHLDLYVAIGPRGEDASGATHYSSEEAINTVVDKMAALYEVGVRNFGLTYDDLGNFGQDTLVGPDIAFFDDHIGNAHAYFAKEVYTRFKANHSDINFMVLPMVYRQTGALSDEEEAYFDDFPQLPNDIQLYMAPEYNEDVLHVEQLTNRKTLVWDNFYASFYNGSGNDAPEYVIPFNRDFDPDHITGFTFLSIEPTNEDAALVSWRSAADYAWAPDRYDSDQSFQRAAARYSGLPGSTTSIYPAIRLSSCLDPQVFLPLISVN